MWLCMRPLTRQEPAGPLLAGRLKMLFNSRTESGVCSLLERVMERRVMLNDKEARFFGRDNKP